MRTSRLLIFGGAAVVAIAGYLHGQQDGQVKIKSTDIGGVVASSKGPEAGVWVIAETTSLPTRYIKEVVTDDRGRYLIPDLPKGKYTVWARGYGLVDSPKAETEPGKLVNLKPTIAPDAKTAAQLYPAEYWYALMKVPEKNEFPGTGPGGNGISTNVKNQGQWLHLIKTDSCESCHQLGNQYTRTIPPMFANFDSPAQAWARRVESGQAGSAMKGGLGQLGPERATAEFGDWTTRIAKGELPVEAPPRPQGLERNVVITQWDWADPKAYLHDEISTDKRHPNVNANGLIYGSPEESSDYLPVLDPVHNTTSQVKTQYRDPNTPGQPKPLQASAFWGEEPIWDTHTTVHNPMFDQKGRIWYTARIRPNANPDFCKAGSTLISAKLTPVATSGVAVVGLRSGDEAEFDDRHLLWHASPAVCGGRQTTPLWTSSGGGGEVIGWLNTKMYDQTHDEAKSQGWSALGAGYQYWQRQTRWLCGERSSASPQRRAVRASELQRRSAEWLPIRRKTRGSTRLLMRSAPLATDGTIWGSILGFPGGIVRVIPGENPPETTQRRNTSEVPWNNPKAPVSGYSPRGMDIDRNGVAWVALGSGHLASSRSTEVQGEPLNGADGDRAALSGRVDALCDAGAEL